MIVHLMCVTRMYADWFLLFPGEVTHMICRTRMYAE